MSWKRSALIPALVAAACLGLAGCGSAPRPAGPAGAPAGPAGTFNVGVTGGHLGDAVTDTSGGAARELSGGGPIDPRAVREAPNTREGVAAGDGCAHAGLMPDPSNLATVDRKSTRLNSSHRCI